MKNLTLIFLSIFVSFQMMAGMENHPLNKKHSYQTFTNISLHVDANLVNAIFQDQEGMIWLGTKRGLYSYNGYDLHEYIDELYPTVIRCFQSFRHLPIIYVSERIMV